MKKQQPCGANIYPIYTPISKAFEAKTNLGNTLIFLIFVC